MNEELLSHRGVVLFAPNVPSTAVAIAIIALNTLPQMEEDFLLMIFSF